MIVDAHFHAWQLSRGDYGWLTPALAPIHRDVSVADWRREAAPLGVDAGVLVQAAPTAAETGFLLALAADDDSVAGVVGWADLLAPDAPDTIAQLAAHPKLKALRPMLHDLADAAWVLQPALAPAFDAMVAHDLAFDALVRPQHLPHLRALCRRYPRLRVVIDHGAKPDIARGAWEPWAGDIAAMAAQTSAVCKLSGLLTEAGASPSAHAARRWMDHLLSCFGPQRLLFGSDWPVLELASSYDDWWRAVHALLVDLPDDARAAILGGNAQRVYRL